MKIDNNSTMTEHFGWRVHPFSDTWRMNPPFCTQEDQRITGQILMMLQYGKSIAVTGPSGSGKSTLMEYVLSKLDTNYYCPQYIHYGGLKRSAILKTLAEKFGVEISGRATPLLVKLQKHVSDLSAGDHPVYPVILIDDAQLLERESFKDLCSLIVCPPKKSAAASLIVVGDEYLAQQLELAVMTSIQTRLTGRYRMKPLTEQESEQFVLARLKGADAPKDLFEPDALSLMAAHCHGNRRKIMNFGTLALGEAYFRQEKTVSVELLTGCDLLVN